MKDLKIKEEVLIWPDSRCCRCCYRNVRICYRQRRDGDGSPLLKKEKKGVLMSSTLKGVGTGASLGTTIMPGIETAIGAGVGAVVRLFLDYLSLRK
jgi:hypothetical protein